MLGVLFGLVALGAFAGSRWLVERVPGVPNAASTPLEFRVGQGESFRSVAEHLEHEGLVVSAFRFRALARLRGVDRVIRKGTYAFVRGADPRTILDDLVAGNVVSRRVTIPEGWRLPQIGEEVERALGVRSAEFLREASVPARLARAGARATSLEGYLFPETYSFEDGTPAAEIVDAMLARFDEVWAAESADVDSIPLGLDRHEIVTLASIVEAETGLPSERAQIAAVYLNRLTLGWKLQADPTVRYAIGKYDGDVLYKDLESESPYNTYRWPGLPPGPIGAPGRAALAATLRPLVSCTDLFFVASADGGHVFTRTLGEHDRAKAHAKRTRAERARAAR